MREKAIARRRDRRLGPVETAGGIVEGLVQVGQATLVVRVGSARRCREEKEHGSYGGGGGVVVVVVTGHLGTVVVGNSLREWRFWGSLSSLLSSPTVLVLTFPRKKKADMWACFALPVARAIITTRPVQPVVHHRRRSFCSHLSLSSSASPRSSMRWRRCCGCP